jgi:TetR/AcrR family acrAB operon transcriptional repressor
MRRTKEEAARTRAAIIDAALTCFDRHGIASSTLDQIAAEAGVTKGAIYWHFKGKLEIFRAIREEITLPMLDRADTSLLHGGERPPLDRIEAYLFDVIDSLKTDRRKRRALAVMHFRCEYAGDLAGELAASRKNTQRLARAFEAAYDEAHTKRQLARSIVPRTAAAETMMVLNGLVRLGILDTTAKGVAHDARGIIQAHIASRRKPGSDPG